MVRARSARTLLAETKNRFWNVPAHWDPSYKRSHTRFNAYTASTGWEVLLIKQYSSDLSVAMTKLEERWDGLEKYWKSNAFDKNRETMREHMKQQTNEIWRRKLQQQRSRFGPGRPFAAKWPFIFEMDTTLQRNAGYGDWGAPAIIFVKKQ